jgi:eukaryotic-like serine/threonine-protein kinase
LDVAKRLESGAVLATGPDGSRATTHTIGAIFGTGRSCRDSLVVAVDSVLAQGWGELSLGSVLARAGEGTIREIVGRRDAVAKIFHPELKDLPEKRDKVAAMVTSWPPRATQSDGFVVLTWPTFLIDDPGGAVGYTMPRIDTATAVEIHMVSNPSNRAEPASTAPQWPRHITWQHLVTVASNLCLAVQTVHQTRAVIGDFQERNILVSDTARVSLVDCDSMQFSDPAGRQYLCGVGRPEFSAPELAGTDLRTTPREKATDLFALAVHIHLLMMGGNHPFLRGNWTGSGDQPAAMTLAKQGQWAGGSGSALHSHPLAPSPDFLPADIRALFVRAFTTGARDPAARPSAAEWRRALLAVTVAKCPRGHHIPIGADPCPWCLINEERARRRDDREAAEGLPAQQISHIGPPPAPSRRTLTTIATSTSPTPFAPDKPSLTAGNDANPTQKSRAKSTNKKVDPFEEFGQSLYRLFKFVAIPVGIIIVALVVWIVVTISKVLSNNNSPTSSPTSSSPSAVPAIGPDGVPAGLPADTETCLHRGTGTFVNSAVSPGTSCRFANNVIDMANESHILADSDIYSVDVWDPDSGLPIYLDCKKQVAMTCRNRSGSLVVYLW